MVYEAVREYPKLKPSKIEFGLPQPNYTINTLAHLSEEYPDGYQFALLMGEDNLKRFHKWKNYEMILENHQIYVYPRVSEAKGKITPLTHSNIRRIDAPIMEISSTFIRTNHKNGKNIRAMLPEAVWKYMDEMNFYR